MAFADFHFLERLVTEIGGAGEAWEIRAERIWRFLIVEGFLDGVGKRGLRGVCAVPSSIVPFAAGPSATMPSERPMENERRPQLDPGPRAVPVIFG
jgi:hypothetical protein